MTPKLMQKIQLHNIAVILIVKLTVYYCTFYGNCTVTANIALCHVKIVVITVSILLGMNFETS